MQTMQVDRLVGGAGTGKTAYLLDRMDALCVERRLAPDQIAFATFTRSGCREMADRAADRWGVLPDDLTNFRTVHSLAYRTLGVSNGQLISDDSDSIAWISEQICVDLTADVDDTGSIVFRPLSPEGADEAAALALWNIARVTLRPMNDIVAERLEAGEHVPPEETIEHVVSQYESAKRLHEKVDYCDIVLRFAGIRMNLCGPRVCEPEGKLSADLRAIFADECQDNSALIDMALMRLAHTRGVEYVILSGDPMQSIYESFAGGSAKHFMGWQASEILMPNSFRCPPPILELGERCLQQMHEGYWDRQIAPANHAGEIAQAGTLLDAIEEHLDPSQQTLIIARCLYSVQNYCELLDDLGIPYSRIGDQHSSSREGFQALWCLERGTAVNGEMWKSAVEMLPAKHVDLGSLLREGEKTAWLTGRREYLDVLRPADLELAGCTSTLADIIRRGEWLSLLSDHKQEAARRWMDDTRRHGHEIATCPRVKIGTIHSAKGMEADVVIMSTESSMRVERGRDMSPLRHDEECRVNYVGVTRARKKLVIVEDGLRHRLILPW